MLVFSVFVNTACLSLSLKRLCLNKKSELFANPQSAKSSFVKIGRALFNPGKLWVVSVAVGAAALRVAGSGYRSYPEPPGVTRPHYSSQGRYLKKTNLDFITLFNLERGEEG